MKKIAILGMMVIVSLSISAQKIKSESVPSPVSDAFKSKYPTAQKAKWEKESSTEYEVEFLLNAVQFSATFNASGAWVETESKVSIKDLPSTVLEAVHKKYPNAEIEESEKVDSAEFGEIYELEIEVDEQEKSILVSTKGAILKEIEEEVD